MMLKKEVAAQDLSTDLKSKIESRIEAIEREIGEEISDDFAQEIIETINNMGGDQQALNGSGRKELWQILKKKYPKISAQTPVGKKDKSGNLNTSHSALKDLYLSTYLHRLRNRPIKSEMNEVKRLKEELLAIRLKLANGNKSVPWNMNDLENVLKTLKQGKSRDPNGWVRDLFSSDIAGKNLKLSMLQMFNRIKEENYIPEFIRKADITTIYKGKGEKTNLENDRGIFLVTTFRTILMKLIYRDKYNIIDSHMSDSQIGGRKGKNVRNHIWVLNGIICDVLSTKKKTPVDIQIVDYKQCFDTLWLEECLNDLYDSGVKDDKLALLYNINSHVKVAVKTPVGITDRKSLFNVITQGDVFGPIICSNLVDIFGKECLVDYKYNYSYKGLVDIPPLGMVDDLVCVSTCGHRSVMLNGFINHKTSSKKLQFGVDKCKKLHVGHVKHDFKCQDLAVEKWEEVEIMNDENDCTEDQFVGEQIMEEKQEEKYLGDVIATDGRNLKNIQKRVTKGKGIINRIFTILEGVPLGRRYFEIGIILRDSLLVSSMLYNSEAWYNITKSELELLESIDRMFLRKLLSTPKGTPKEMLYLEMGCIPFQDLIRERRLRFLHYILNQKENSLLYKVLKCQLENSSKKDWIRTIKQDLKELQMENLSLEEIKGMRKTSFEKLIKEQIKDNVFEKLTNLKKSHSKVNTIEHGVLKIQKYLQPNHVRITKEESQLIFKLRSRMTNTKTNLKRAFNNTECDACGKADETQEHIVKCNDLNEDNMENYDYEKLKVGTVSEQLKIAKKFKENFKKLENLRKQ